LSHGKRTPVLVPPNRTTRVESCVGFAFGYLPLPNPLADETDQWDVAEDIIVSMAATHISEAEAVRNFAGLLTRVRAGEEIVIESGTAPVAVLRPAGPPRRSIALAEARSKELGYKPLMDAAFAADMEDIVRKRKPRDTSAWD
jgi:antitoxin (DNA-binding transcriptional repressor) of toxin-antitoxin stability system